VAVKVSVVPNVTGGCLDNPDALKTEAELVLRRSRIKVVEDYSGHHLAIMVVGHALGGGCVAYIGLQTARIEALADGTNGIVESAYQGGFLKGPKVGFPQKMSERVNAWVSELANEILKAGPKARYSLASFLFSSYTLSLILKFQKNLVKMRRVS
jgi:hypothetical protein